MLPTRIQFFSLGHLGVIGTSFAMGNDIENAVYIGLPLLVALAALTIAYRHDGRLVYMSVMVLACYLMSLGVTLNVDGKVTDVGLPFRLLGHFPLLDGAIAARLFAFGYLFLAVALAIGVDHLRNGPARAATSARRVSPLLRPAMCGLVLVAVLVPLWPRLPLRSPPSRPSAVYGSYAVPPFFSASGEAAVPAGSPVLVYPYSTDGFNDYSVLWQAAGGERFRLVDGNATRVGPGGDGDTLPPSIDPPLLEVFMLDSYYGVHKHRLPRLDAPALELIRRALVNYDFSTVVVAPVGAAPQDLIAAMTASLGQRPVSSDGVYVWYGVQHDLSVVSAQAA